MVASAPQKGDWAKTLFFFAVAAALTAVVTYYVNKQLEKKDNE